MTEIVCPKCDSSEVIHSGSGHFVCCDCDWDWKPAAESKADHHVVSETGYYCTYHSKFECSMVAVHDCIFTCEELSVLVRHIIHINDEHHRTAIYEMLYAHMDG